MSPGTGCGRSVADGKPRVAQSRLQGNPDNSWARQASAPCRIEHAPEHSSATPEQLRSLASAERPTDSIWICGIGGVCWLLSPSSRIDFAFFQCAAPQPVSRKFACTLTRCFLDRISSFVRQRLADALLPTPPRRQSLTRCFLTLVSPMIRCRFGQWAPPPSSTDGEASNPGPPAGVDLVSSDSEAPPPLVESSGEEAVPDSKPSCNTEGGDTTDEDTEVYDLKI